MTNLKKWTLQDSIGYINKTEINIDIETFFYLVNILLDKPLRCTNTD